MRSWHRKVPLLLVIALVACSDDGSQRSFANNPAATESAFPATATVVTAGRATVKPTQPAASPVSFEALLAAGGGPTIVYLPVGADLVALAAPWNKPRLVWRGAEGRIWAFSSSPTGDRVALLVSPTGRSDGGLDLVVVAGDGSVVARLKGIDKLAGSSNAASIDRPNGAGSLSWSPDSSRFLVGLPAGGILSVPIDGKPKLLVGPARVKAPGAASWSPKGDAIAFLDPASRGKAAGLYVAPTGTTPLDPVPIVSPAADGRRTISDAVWLPNGEGLLYTVAAVSGDSALGGDLFAVSVAGGAPRLVAGAARVAPVSAITDFAVSPDGRAVAYVITSPGETGIAEQTLWLQPIDGWDVRQLPVPSGETVDALGWTNDGLLWSTVPVPAAGTPPARTLMTVYHARAGETPSVVYHGGEPVAATPVASPVASPVGSPPATPAAR
jgi:dipeptidyl aminopeptidase/acylaminoacyl peptidase